jgi:quinohemoprotein amine dehydrogenase
MDTAVSGHSIAAYQHRLHSLRIANGSGLLRAVPVVVAMMLAPLLLPGQTATKPREEGIPVTDPLVISKCGTCHARDERGNMERISWERTTPEGWQEALKKMILEKHVDLTPLEARSIVKSLSATHGLAPDEARAVMYYPERRIHDETGIADDDSLGACTTCHAAARPLSWRRSLDDWKQLAASHVTQYKVKQSDAAIAFLGKAAPLHSADWAAWSARTSAANPAGRWLVTAHLQGRGKYFGEMQVDPGNAPGEFATRVTLHSIQDGATIVRTGQTLLFGGYAWRGRSRGTSAASSLPGDPSSEAREALWLSPDQTRAEGRWFWGQYQEFGFDVELRRPSQALTLLAVDRQALKIGSQGNSIRLIGDHVPAGITPKDLNLGPGVTVRRIISASPEEVVAEVDVAANAASGKHDVTLRGSVLKDALAIYDRVDYIRVTPESSMAGFGSQKYARGYEQFEAIGYQRGPDGKPHTADDLELGPIDAAWSMEVFYEVDSSRNDLVGKVSSAGLFSPAAENPGVNHDIWVIATAVNEMGKDGKPLAGKGYVVVTIPEYSFNGRHYVRDLDRWIEDGTW